MGSFDFLSIETYHMPNYNAALTPPQATFLSNVEGQANKDWWTTKFEDYNRQIVRHMDAATHVVTQKYKWVVDPNGEYYRRKPNFLVGDTNEPRLISTHLGSWDPDTHPRVYERVRKDITQPSTTIGKYETADDYLFMENLGVERIPGQGEACTRSLGHTCMLSDGRGGISPLGFAGSGNRKLVSVTGAPCFKDGVYAPAAGRGYAMDGAEDFARYNHESKQAAAMREKGYRGQISTPAQDPFCSAPSIVISESARADREFEMTHPNWTDLDPEYRARRNIWRHNNKDLVLHTEGLSKDGKTLLTQAQTRRETNPVSKVASVLTGEDSPGFDLPIGTDPVTGEWQYEHFSFIDNLPFIGCATNWSLIVASGIDGAARKRPGAFDGDLVNEQMPNMWMNCLTDVLPGSKLLKFFRFAGGATVKAAEKGAVRISERALQGAGARAARGAISRGLAKFGAEGVGKAASTAEVRALQRQASRTVRELAAASKPVRNAVDDLAKGIGKGTKSVTRGASEVATKVENTVGKENMKALKTAVKVPVKTAVNIVDRQMMKDMVTDFYKTNPSTSQVDDFKRSVEDGSVGTASRPSIDQPPTASTVRIPSLGGYLPLAVGVGLGAVVLWRVRNP